MFQNNRKMPFILAAVLIFAIWSNWDFIFGDKKKAPVAADFARRAVQRPQDQQANTAKTPEKKAQKKAPEKVVDHQQMMVLAQGKNWGRNPFGLTPKVKKKSKPAAEVTPEKKPSDPTTLNLESILITQFQSLAVINNQLLTEGDLFQGKKIAKITEDSVFIEEYGITKELKMAKHGIPMTYVKTTVPGSKTNKK